MSTLAIETELGKLQMFSGCSQELLADLSHAAQSQMAADGLVIHGKGDHSDAMMIVLRGCVGVCVGDECIMQLRKGDHLGETLFLAVEDYWSVQLVAQDLCMVCEISRDDLMTVLKEHPADKELLNPSIGSCLGGLSRWHAATDLLPWRTTSFAAGQEQRPGPSGPWRRQH